MARSPKRIMGAGEKPSWKLIRVSEYFERNPLKHAIVIGSIPVGGILGLLLVGPIGAAAGFTLSLVAYFLGRGAEIRVRNTETIASGSIEPEGLRATSSVIGGSLEGVPPDDPGAPPGSSDASAKRVAP